MKTKLILLLLVFLTGVGLYIWNDSVHNTLQRVFNSSDAGWAVCVTLLLVALSMKKN